MEQMRNLLRPSTSHTAAEGSPSELSTPRSSLSSSHRTTPSFNDLSFGASSDAEASYAEPSSPSLRTISQPSIGRNSADAAMDSRPSGLSKLSAALAMPMPGKRAGEAPSRGPQSVPQDIPGSQSVTNSPKGRWREGKIHGMDLYDYHSLHNDLVRGTSL